MQCKREGGQQCDVQRGQALEGDDRQGFDQWPCREGTPEQGNVDIHQNWSLIIQESLERKEKCWRWWQMVMSNLSPFPHLTSFIKTRVGKSGAKLRPSHDKVCIQFVFSGQANLYKADLVLFYISSIHSITISMKLRWILIFLIISSFAYHL